MLFRCPMCDRQARVALGKCRRGAWWHCIDCHNKFCARRGYPWTRILPVNDRELPLVVHPTDPPPWGLSPDGGKPSTH